MKQKIVIKVPYCDKAKSKCFASGYPRVIAVMDDDDDQFNAIVVVGEDINTKDLMKKLCKEVRQAQLRSVIPEGFTLAPFKQMGKDRDDFLIEENEKLKARVVQLEKKFEDAVIKDVPARGKKDLVPW